MLYSLVLKLELILLKRNMLGFVKNPSTRSPSIIGDVYLQNNTKTLQPSNILELLSFLLTEQGVRFRGM